MKKVYTTRVTAMGGRNGRVQSEDGILNAEVRVPGMIGGTRGTHLNPETLLAAGYASSFDSALNTIIRLERIQTGTTSVTASVSIGRIDNGVMGLALTLEIAVPGVAVAKAENLVQKAQQVCPFSLATKGNIEIQYLVSS